MKSTFNCLIVAGLAIILQSVLPAHAGWVKLSKDQVSKCVINKSWLQGKNNFTFKNSGYYSYKGRVVGKYTLRKSGKIRGKTTTYTFYVNDSGEISYKNTKSNTRWDTNLTCK